MPAFEYIALNASGKEVKGVLEGDTARQVRQQLRERKLNPLSVTEGAAARDDQDKSTSAPRSRRGIRALDLALITRQLATLVASGTQVEEALSAVSKQTEKRRIKTLLLSVRGRVLEGHTLADSLAGFPRVFPEIYRATVAAGEQSGHLDGVLERLADYTESRQETGSAILKALIYPAMLIFLSTAIVIFLLTYMVPQIVTVYEDLDAELPALTQAMIGLSEIIKSHGLWILIAVAVAIFAFRAAMQKEAFKSRVHAVALRLPIFRGLIRAANSAQFSRTLSILASSGVPVLQALAISAQVLGNRVMRGAVRQASLEVREGSSMSSALERSACFPPMMIHLIASGEASGRLGDMLERAASHQEREVNTKLALFLGLFQPGIMVVMGLVILAIVLSVMLPIFQVNQLVG